MLSELYQRALRMIGRGRGIVQDDTGPVQLVQVQASELETLDDRPRVAEYGFQSCPPDGFDAVVVFFGGDRSNGVVVGTGHQAYRIKGLKKGETALSDNLGQSIYISQDGIVINSAGLTVTINGNVTINGTLAASGDVTADGTSLHTHVHGGVQPGGSDTGVPV